MPVFLIRHAHAGHRSDWDGPDEERPLSPRGRRESDHIAARLGHEPIGRLVTSPAIRCQQTIAPLAAARGRDADIDKRFGEGRDPVKAIERILRLADDNTAVCAHGDLIPDMIRLLSRRGMKIIENGPTKKGSFWSLDFDGESFTKATYHPPST